MSSKKPSPSHRPIAGKPNTLLRLLVPLVLALGGIGVAAAVWVNSNNPASRQQATTPNQRAEAPATEDGAPVADTSADSPPETVAPNEPAGPDLVETDADASPPPIGPDADSEAAPVSSASDPSPEALPADTSSYRAERFDRPGGLWSAPSMGQLETEDTPSPYEAFVTFSPVGAGIAELRLSKHYETVQREEHALVIAENTYPAGRLTPMAVLGVEINGRYVPMSVESAGEADPIWRAIEDASGRPEPGAFEAYVLNDAGERVVRVERRYQLDEGSFDLRLRQRAENLTDQTMRLRVYQSGPVDLRQESFYGGDKRRVRFGYFLDPQRDPNQQFVVSDGRLAGRGSLLGGKVTENVRDSSGNVQPIEWYPAERPVWPNSRSDKGNWTLVWTAFTNRYFGVAVHPLVALDAEGQGDPRPLTVFERVDRVLADRFDGDGLMLRFATPVRTIEPGEALSFSHGVYAGPLSRQVINVQPAGRALNLAGVVAYNLGGPCSFCTFSWLTESLHTVLLFAHDYLVRDWALAIILLVVVVRTCLHPITRWSQIRMQRFGKQMQAMGPKQKELQKKYKDDPKKLQQEMGRLMREEGVNPAGMLGCLPMFLQMPIWVALYATLYYSFEMRHAPAFYGVFQTISGGAWSFLGDLAQPDSFFKFPGALDLGIIKIDSFNILPLLMGVVFFLQQKYLTPPTSGAMTPEQESQARLMKIMMVVMFPVFMYAAPAGLSLYFITSSTLGILESRYIRADAEKKGLLDPKPKDKDAKKAKKSGGFMDRLQKMIEDQQRAREEGQSGGGRANERARQEMMRDRERKPKGLPQVKRKKKK
ncbi:MAG: membrane protein insertase YidC [Planctomycetota bacterium]